MAELHGLCAQYVWVSLLALMLYVSIIYCMKKRRQRSPETKSDLKGDGIFVLHEWGFVPRGIVSAVILIGIAVPAMLFLSCFLFGAGLALAEGWTSTQGVYYLVGNMIGVGPLVQLAPVSNVGRTLDILASLWSLLVTAIVLGLAAGVNLAMHMSSKVPRGVFGLVRTLFIYVPMLLICLAVLTGMFLAYLEDWGIGQGILYMMGALCGIEDPLTPQSPRTAEGNFFTILCFCLELSLAGAIIAVVGSHDAVEAFLRWCEGEGLPEPEDNAAASPGAENEDAAEKQATGDWLVKNLVEKLEEEHRQRMRLEMEVSELARLCDFYAECTRSAPDTLLSAQVRERVRAGASICAGEHPDEALKLSEHAGSTSTGSTSAGSSSCAVPDQINGEKLFDALGWKKPFDEHPGTFSRHALCSSATDDEFDPCVVTLV